jgi:hypothetical protein
MGTPVAFAPEKLVMAILTSRIDRIKEILGGLREDYGPTDFVSEVIPFDFTGYYDREMGEGIRRLFVSFDRLVAPDSLSAIKLATNSREDLYREGGGRTVNLDPGLLCLSRFVLATTKESSHRIPLAHGIYAEVTLVFEKGSFRPMEWTYPDYRSEIYIAVLNEIRRLYRNQVRPARARP